MGFLDGVSVVELGANISASACTKTMAALGAEVIKIEPPGQGDPSRNLGPFPDDKPDIEKSGTFLYLNMAKKSLTLDISTAEGKKVFKDLVKKADILVEDLGYGVLNGLGFPYTELAQACPRLVMTSISPFGNSGNYANYKAEDIVIEAAGGLLLQNGDPNREPLKMGGNIIYHRAGASAFTGSLMALYHAEATGIGQQVEVSIQECLLHDDFITIESYQARREIITRRLASLLLPARDGWYYIRAFTHEWARFVRAIGLPELETDERFIDVQQRSIHAEELNALVMSQFMGMTKKQIYDKLQQHHITVGYIANTEDIYHSEQYAADDFFVSIDHPEAGRLTYPGAFATMGDIPWNYGRAPILGEDTVEILHNLNYTDQDISNLREAGVI
jgi:CoA:oxalate CoA-transferase